MKWKYIIPFLLIAIGINTVSGQEFDLSFSSSESGTQTHQARNSVSLLAGYTYTPGGTGMVAEIVNPVVNGSISYNYTPVDPANRSINTSYLVGTTQGAFDVNPAGGASYTIPIDVLPGVNGLAPSLSLVYSSNSGPGVAGYGWQIGGLSVVSRSGQNYYNDVAATGVDLASTDRFSLDGQRLVLAPSTGTYGANGTTYQTEIDGFTRVQSLTTNGYGPEKFLAQTKSGLKNLYGYDEDGKQRLDGINEILNWYVTETSDLYGNLISYSYLKDNSVVYPAEITYGPNKVTFYYKTRTDVTTTYLKGKKIIQQLLLDKVTVSYNSNVVKTYQLKYIQVSDNYNTYSALNEVIESGTGGSQLNSTVFSYLTPANVAMAQSTYNTTDAYVTYMSRMCTGDFNGDGKADFLCLPDASKGAAWTGMKVCYGDGNDNFSSVSSLTNTIDLSKLDDMQALDINGDGKDDFLYELVNSGTSSFYYMLSTGTSFGTLVSIPGTQPNNSSAGMGGKDRRRNGKQEKDNELSGADYDGDGTNEIFLNDPNGNWRILSPTDRNSVLIKGSGTISTLAGQTLSGDFNGDGKADIWSFETTGVKIYTFSGSSLTQIYTSTWPTKDHFFTLGDFNADGKVDIFLYGYKSGSTEYDWSDWQVQLSTGTGFEQLNIPQKKANLKNDYVRLGDFNGDGCTDLMVTSLNQSWTGTYFYITKNKGTDFYTHTLPGYPVESHNYYVSDYNGDGRTDFICTDGLPAWWNGYQVYKSTGNTTPLLEKVANGLNHLTTIAYTKLSQAPSTVYQLGSTTPGFPVFNFQGPLAVVSSITMDNGIGSTNSLSYYYEGAKIHRQGKGFLCYSKMTATDATAGMLTETQSGYDNTYFYPQVNTVTKKLSPSGSTVETTSNTWAQTVLDATTKRIFPYVQSSTQTNALTGYSVTGSISSFDSYCNPTQTVKTYSNGVSETTVSNYTNIENSTDWKLGRLDNSTITYAKSGETSVSHTVRYTYFTDGILKPDFIYYNEGSALEFSKNHDYDSRGNVTQVYTYGASIGASQLNFTYDTDLVRVKTKTDELGHVTTFNYNSYGQLQTDVDYLNNTNTYAYDAVARQTSISNTNGSQTTTSYVWTGTNKPALGFYGVTQTGNDGSVSTVWYDKVQRAIRAEKKGFGGTMILIDTEYNAKGQVYRVSDPYFAGGSLVWAETYTTYDNYGRVTVITRNTGRNTTYSYSSATVSETTAGKTFSKTYGADGTLTSATDNGGTINYTYYADGKTKNITAPGGVVTSMQYADAARNQTQLVDPSAGTINYTYDALGRVKTQTDARSKLTTYTYLADGRNDNIVNPEGTTTYSYNTNKQLTGISNSTTSVSRTYGYDTKGRVTSVGETIAGPAFSTSFTYDSYGRLSTRTHPSTIVETMNYNSNGYLSSISAGGSTRYTITSMNARQQLTGSTYGSNLTATYGFDTYGYPTSTATGSVQDYRYVFDATTGNLTSRQNFLRSKSESFTYDNLDRLLTATGPQNLTMTYASNGNLS
ncbi:MAG: hypothetical protein C0397_12175, partial [Odoribacter sp.]|nr:hypothetical protein [Odoribacter sp.]